MGLATAIFSALAAIPGILAYLKQFGIWLNEQIVSYEKQKAAVEFKKAVAEAKRTKDGSLIDQMFNPDKKK